MEMLATHSFTAAIALRRRQPHLGKAWRLALATFLASTGQVSDAMREARVGPRLRPRDQAAQDLIDRLSKQLVSGS